MLYFNFWYTVCMIYIGKFVCSSSSFFFLRNGHFPLIKRDMESSKFISNVKSIGHYLCHALFSPSCQGRLWITYRPCVNDMRWQRKRIFKRSRCDEKLVTRKKNTFQGFFLRTLSYATFLVGHALWEELIHGKDIFFLTHYRMAMISFVGWNKDVSANSYHVNVNKFLG